MKKILAITLAVFFLSGQQMQAGDKEWSVVGKVLTGIFAVKVLNDVTTPKTVVVTQPQQVVVQQPPTVVYQQPPVVYTPPVIVHQPPTVVYQTAPVCHSPVVIHSSTTYRQVPIIRRSRARSSVSFHFHN